MPPPEGGEGSPRARTGTFNRSAVRATRPRRAMTSRRVIPVPMQLTELLPAPQRRNQNSDNSRSIVAAPTVKIQGAVLMAVWGP